MDASGPKNAQEVSALAPLSHPIAPKNASYNRILQSAISSPKPASRSEAGVPWYVWRSVAAEGALPAAASFPYGFPKPGATGIFDAKVEN